MLAAACARRQGDVRGSTADITAVELIGVHRFTEAELLAYLHMGESSRLPWRPRFPYLPANLPVDAARIVDVYRAFGYYDAEVTSITASVRPGRRRLFPRTPGERRRGAATIRVVVREGRPTPVRRLDLDFPDGPPPPDPKVSPKVLTLKPGQPFEIPRLDDSVARVRDTLQAAGFAYADVHEAATVTPGLGADVRLAVRPGPRVTIGALRFQGLGPIPERYARNEVDFAIGRRYAPRLARRIEEAVYALEVFDTVTVDKPLPPARDGPIALTVRVRPARPQSIKLGGGFGFDPVRWEQRVTLLYTHRNLARNLTRLDLRAQLGYAELPSLLRPIAHGPTFKLDPTLRQKGLLEKRTVATLAPAFELGIWEGYQFYTPTLRAGLSRFFSRFLEIELTYNLRFVDFFNVSPTLDVQRSILGLDFRDPYFLSYLEPAVRLYLTDSILKPTNGAILGVVYDLAGLGGDFSAHKIHPSLRLYWTPHWRFTLAARVELGWIVPFGPKGGMPIDLRFYLGGADTVRGWGLRRLSPRAYPPGCDATSDTCRGIPIGGDALVLGNLEARVRATEMLSLVAFVDAGDVRPGLRQFRPSLLNVSAGPGVRLDTPIGVFRLDLGVRLGDTAYGEGERRWALHFGLGEAF